MYELLLKLLIVSAILRLGLSYSDFTECCKGHCHGQLIAARNKVLKVDWRPISLWPEEAKKFR